MAEATELVTVAVIERATEMIVLEMDRGDPIEMGTAEMIEAVTEMAIDREPVREMDGMIGMGIAETIDRRLIAPLVRSVQLRQP